MIRETLDIERDQSVAPLIQGDARENTSVAICVATFRRPAGLRRALLSFDRLNMEDLDTEVEIVVVDNDSQRSGEGVIRELEANLGWPIVYVVEPRQGISHARNAGIQAVHADLIAFVDDDEEAAPEWLRELILFERSTGASIITGPVVPMFEDEPPSWVTRGRFFERPRHPTGTVVQHAGTGNLMLRRTVLSDIGDRPFEDAMALTGGEDTLLSMRLGRAGHAILWCDEAIIREWNPSWRTTASWLIRRAFRGGTTYARSESIVYRSTAVRLVRILKGLIHSTIQAAGRLLFGVLTLRFDRIVSGAQRAALGSGMVLGAAGFRYEEYGRAARSGRTGGLGSLDES